MVPPKRNKKSLQAYFFSFSHDYAGVNDTGANGIIPVLHQYKRDQVLKDGTYSTSSQNHIKDVGEEYLHLLFHLQCLKYRNIIIHQQDTTNPRVKSSNAFNMEKKQRQHNTAP